MIDLDLDVSKDGDTPFGVQLVGGLFFGFVSFLLACATAASDLGFLTAWFCGASLITGLVAAFCFCIAAVEATSA
jgi:hypothetical protein